MIARKRQSFLDKPKTTRNSISPLLNLEKDAQKQISFRYLRFRCQDLPRTIDFYETIGMKLDNKIDPDVSNSTTYLAFSFPPQIKEIAEKRINIQLLFQHDDNKVHTTTTTPLPDHSHEYLVIYIHLMNRVIKRFTSKGFSIKMNPIDINETKMCILIDPNGIEVRLMELLDVHLGGKVNWFARLGYYTIPINHGKEVVSNYEKVFGGKKDKKQNEPVFLRNLDQGIQSCRLRRFCNRAI